MGIIHIYIHLYIQIYIHRYNSVIVFIYDTYPFIINLFYFAKSSFHMTHTDQSVMLSRRCKMQNTNFSHMQLTLLNMAKF